MANIKSQIKRNGTNKKAQERNKAVKSELKTAVRATREAVVAGDKDKATAALRARRQEDRQGRQQGRHPQEPGGEPQVGHRQAGRRALSSDRPRALSRAASEPPLQDFGPDGGSLHVRARRRRAVSRGRGR